MPFTLEQRYKILSHLNFALLRCEQVRSNHEDWGGELYHFSAKLNPTEYQANRPRPMIFDESDTWLRLNRIEKKSEFLVQQIIAILEQLEAIELGFKTMNIASDAVITKADIVEFDRKSRLEGLTNQRDENIEKLRYFLELPPTPGNSGGWTTPLHFG